ncbi:MAG: ABC transporter ATP-binding protein [Candidatus Riflebacteria bacterium]|jgi:putative ABC transport system ATP-binding protein|nr:ABC transporter ATP-binding protein [Candidatus Riflebacteria bacterium]
MTTLLKVENLKKAFNTRGITTRVLDDVTFSVETGEIFLITGRSGTGKSTLLGLLAGLDQASSGTIDFQGREITGMSLSELADLRAATIGMIFQSFNLIPSWTALENVEAVLMHRGIGREERRTRSAQLLGELGLKDRLHNLPAELSVGQQQRVAIARTLVNEPALILADEPTGDVDPETAADIMGLLLPRIKSGKTTMIVASHGLFDPGFADRVACLKDGRLEMQPGIITKPENRQ